MLIFGIFGDPIEHSLSPSMHCAALQALGEAGCYHAFRVTSDRLADAIRGAAAMGFAGLNLTIPHKEHALQMVHPDDLAMSIGAVNTISFARDGEIRGHNTDGAGAVLALHEAGVKISKGESRVLLIGAGGAARAIAYTLAEEGAEISIVNRSAVRALELAKSIGGSASHFRDLERLVAGADVVINATSVGMKEGDPRLFDRRLLHSGQVVFDVVYNRDTELLQDARAAGAVAVDGVMMLVYQGAKALEIWTGRKAPLDAMERAVREGLKDRQGQKALTEQG